MTDFTKMKVSELKEELSNRGLPQAGTKQKLIDRLLQYIEDEKLIAGNADADAGDDAAAVEADDAAGDATADAAPPADNDITTATDAAADADSAAAAGADAAADSTAEGDEAYAGRLAAIEAKKARAERFGITDATVEQFELQKKIDERKKRFGLESLTPEQRARAERFGIDPVAAAAAREARAQAKLARASKGGQDGKSKSKGGNKAEKGKGGAKANAKKFEGECRNCGRKGHKAAECRAPGGGAAAGGGAKQAKKFDGECRNCGRKGHKAADCRAPGGGAHNQGNPKRRQSGGGGGDGKRSRREPAAPAAKKALTPAQQAKQDARRARFSS